MLFCSDAKNVLAWYLLLVALNDAPNGIQTKGRIERVSLQQCKQLSKSMNDEIDAEQSEG